MSTTGGSSSVSRRIVAWLISVYNGLVAMGQRVSQAFADIDVQIAPAPRSHSNLVETVKGYAAHERAPLKRHRGPQRRMTARARRPRPRPSSSSQERLAA